MRWRRLIWPGLVIAAITAAVFWHYKGQRPSALVTSEAVRPANPIPPQVVRSQSSVVRKTGQITRPGSFQLLSQAGPPNIAAALTPPPDERFPHRLSNTSEPIKNLVHNSKAILLENAFYDTSASFDPVSIPDSLASTGDPGAYIVQSKNELDAKFQFLIKQSGATIISYIPNNAYLVRATASEAGQLAALPQTQTVLPYEPYYKIKASLLGMAVEGQPLPADAGLNLLVFPGAEGSTLAQIKTMGVTVVSQERSPFGQIVHIQQPPQKWTDLARLSGVQVVELSRSRVRANDLTRVRLNIATNSTTTSNYLGLTGKGIMVNVNDTGVDATHPDLAPRVFADIDSSLTDTNGHGTHVAGIIASSGEHYQEITNASGSVMPPTNGQFRGMAPEANIFSLSVDASFGIGGQETSFGPIGSDAYLQEAAARTNAFISNNSWHYGGDTDYDLAAASYDAAVRDALPGVTGSQPVLYVFAAGNGGGGNDEGSGGGAGTVNSPATAKNAITVGSIEQARNITNKTRICRPSEVDTNGNTLCETNVPWQGMTDSSNQVAFFSARGNVGIGTEGEFGRFKPDLVAPGTFVISTTEKDHWDQVSYYNPTNYHFDVISDQVVETNTTDPFSIFVPYNAVQFIIRVFAPEDLRIYVRQSDIATSTNFDFVRTNIVSVPPDATLTPTEADWFYSIESMSSHPVPFTILTEIVTTNDLGDYLDVLSNLNDTLGPYYRYESGTSMSAADVSGMLALVKQWFEQSPPGGIPHTNSPALMKALMINGSRSVDARYDFSLNRKINFQGWGLPNLPTIIPTNAEAFVDNPTGPASMLFFDQSTNNALATGQSRSYRVSVVESAQANPLRVTLVWTDPPGNPIAGTKLVNDLDLVVSNEVTGDVFYGNDIPAGSNFNLPTDTNAPPILDVVNNVENVFLPPDLSSNYTITVVAHRVNVNAVTGHTNDMVQDYALVISSGDGETNALRIVEAPVTAVTNFPFLTIISNSFAGDPATVGGMLLNQHVGANSPLLGTNTLPLPQYNGQLTIGVTNQWHFYAITNSTAADFTNAAFLTFLPPTLSVPRMGTRESDPNNASRVEADIDLYVSTNPGLTNLDPAVINAAINTRYVSLGRGGTETVVISNAQPGAVYYIGVKSEDHEAAEYGFLGVFSNLPFGSGDDQGNLKLRGFPVNAAIPDGNPANPGGTYIFAVAPKQITVRRVIATNTISHQLVSDLFGKLSHGEDFAVLNNHSGAGPVTNVPYVYNDSNQRAVNHLRTDGPGTLRNFASKEGAGQWMLTMIDNAPGHFGTNVSFWVWLEKQQDLLGDGITVTLNGGECSEDFIFVPVEATNLTVIGSITSGGGPVDMTVCPIDASGSDCKTVKLIGSATNSITIDKTSNPPLNPGFYVVQLCNNDALNPVTVHIKATLGLDLNGVIPTILPSGNPITILDDAVTSSTIGVTRPEKIVSVDVGVRIDHPRISDLVLTLVGPDGTRVLLDENRGGFTTNGMGIDLIHTNIVPVGANGGPDPQTNSIDTGMTSGTLTIDYNFYDAKDQMTVYYEGNLLWDSGMINGVGTKTITFGPGASTIVTIIMNEFGNPGSSTIWDYVVNSTTAQYIYTTFTDDTNKTVTPIKFAIPPYLPQLVQVTLWRNGFEDGSPGIYAFGTPSNHFGAGWSVDSGEATVLNTGYRGASAFEGDRFVELSDVDSGTISTNLQTVVGRAYQVNYYYAANPDATNTQTANILANGNPPGSIAALAGSNTWPNLNWLPASYGFTAATNLTTLSFQGTSGTNGLLIDYVTISETTTNLYVQPEDVGGLDAFRRMSAEGDWRLEVWDNRVGAFATNGPPTLRSWALSFIFETAAPEPVELVDNGPYTNTVGPGQIQYFIVKVPYWAAFASNELIFASQPVDLLYDPFAKPVGNIPPDYVLLPASTGGTNVLQTTGPAPILFPNTTYYLAVTNPGVLPASFALQVHFNVTPLTNSIPYPSVINSNDFPRFFSYDVSTNETGVSFMLYNLDGNVDLVARRKPFPDLGLNDYGSFNPGTNVEDIIVYTNTEPVLLTPGRWYLGVFNRTATNVDYTILVTSISNGAPTIITLTNAVPYVNTNDGTGLAIDYYRFVVSTNSVRAQFEINGPTADMTLVVRHSYPLPNLGNYDYASANPGTNDELIVLHDYSSPIPLTPGEWLISAVNVSGGPASYSIMATEWSQHGTNIVVTNTVISGGGSSFCITWTSLPGAHYFVEGKVDLTDVAWATVSPTITATNYSTTYCIPLPSPFHFFRVREGLAGTGSTMPMIAVNISSLSRTNNAFLLQWSGPPSAKYEVQWSPSIPPAAWTTFSNIVTSPSGVFSFSDDGTQSGGFGAARFYRLQQIP